MLESKRISTPIASKRANLFSSLTTIVPTKSNHRKTNRQTRGTNLDFSPAIQKNLKKEQKNQLSKTISSNNSKQKDHPPKGNDHLIREKVLDSLCENSNIKTKKLQCSRQIPLDEKSLSCKENQFQRIKRVKRMLSVKRLHSTIRKKSKLKSSHSRSLERLNTTSLQKKRNSTISNQKKKNNEKFERINKISVNTNRNFSLNRNISANRNINRSHVFTPSNISVIKKAISTSINSLREVQLTPKRKKKNTLSKNQGERALTPYHKRRMGIRYSYCILPNNNGKLVERCLLTRKDRWEKIDKSHASLANLYWTPLSYKIHFQKVDGINQYVNHLENHSELSNKMKLFTNLIRHCEFNKIDIFSFYPLTVEFHLTHVTFMEQLNGFHRLYRDVPKLTARAEDNASSYRNVYFNYCTVNLSKKTGTEQNIKIPRTHYQGKNLWLIKPVNLNRGRCIKILSDLDEISREIMSLKEKREFSSENGKKSLKAEYILLQKYIEKPLLYKGRKFDIRMWVLFTEGDFFVFKEGHLKAICDQYDVNSSDPFIHLTNYSVQKHNTNFSKTEVGNEISFGEFQSELDHTTNPRRNFRKEIYPKICNIIRITEAAVKSKLYVIGNKSSFEIFGYDFLIDADFNPFLIEINTNPGYEESSPLIKMLVPRMIDDALRLTVDSTFPRDRENDQHINMSPFEVNGYDNRENLWQKLSK